MSRISSYWHISSLCFWVLVSACNSLPKGQKSKAIPQLRFVGEYILPFETKKDGMTVGGLSALDYDSLSEKWYLLSDDLYDENGRLRFYTATLDYDSDTVRSLEIEKTHFIKQENGQLYPLKSEGVKDADPESLRYFARTNTFFWSSEGDRKRNILPFVAQMDTSGAFLNKIPLPESITSTEEKRGWYHNSAIESLSLAASGNEIWIATENPLQQDGQEIRSNSGDFPIRLSLLSLTSGRIIKEIAYNVEPVSRPIKEKGFGMNGVVEILAWQNDQLLVLERSYVSGYPAGSNVVRLFLVDTSSAQDIQNLSSLRDTEYKFANKKLITDLSELGVTYIDNIEGMSFGKRLPNGNQSLVFVSDNNFQAIQRTQFLVFEIMD